MPISPEPPRARKRSSLPGFICFLLNPPCARSAWGGGPHAVRWRGLCTAPPPPFRWSPSPPLRGREDFSAVPLYPLVQQRQPLNRQIGLYRVEHLAVTV